MMFRNPSTVMTSSKGKKKKHPHEQLGSLSQGVRINAAPLTLKNEKCTTWIVKLVERKRLPVAHTLLHTTCKCTLTTNHEHLAESRRSPPPGRESCTGPGEPWAYGGFAGSLGVMPVRSRMNIRGHFSSFRNQILYFFSLTKPSVYLEKAG